MVNGLIGKKMNMSQRFDSHGRIMPLTNVLVEPNFVVQVKTLEKDGYKAAQLGIDQNTKLNKPQEGRVKKAKLKIKPQTLREFNFDGEVSLSQEIRVEEVFHKGNIVDVIGISKGKGFAGVVKRYGFAGGPRTHGQSDRERAPGSIGATTTPGRVLKGTKMAGHMGAERVKTQALEILDIDKDNNILKLKGSVPGFTGSFLVIERSKKKRKNYHEPEITTVPSLGKKDEGGESVTDEGNQSAGKSDTGSPVEGEVEKKEHKVGQS